MSLLDDFLENTGIFNGQEARIDEAAYEALIEKHGPDVAKGYLKAVQEITEVVSNIMRAPKRGWTFDAPQSPATVFGKMCLLHKALYRFAKNQNFDMDHIQRPLDHVSRVKGW